MRLIVANDRNSVIPTGEIRVVIREIQLLEDDGVFAIVMNADASIAAWTVRNDRNDDLGEVE